MAVADASAQPQAQKPTGSLDLSHDANETAFAKRVIADPTLPRMPKIGLDEKLYLRVAQEASQKCDDLTHEAAKVGQYVTLGVRDPDKPWAEKLKCFRHALKRHCQPPEHADEPTKRWYKQLANHVRKYTGREALRLSMEVNERFEARLAMGQTADDVAEDAETFFDSVCPNCGTCPPVYREEEWAQIREIRDKWI
ncbi:MAG: hypothetical protein AAGI46_10070 [Planctomycetota bacterium]